MGRRELSAVELTRAVLERLQATEPRVRAYLHPTPELALRQAEEADRRLAAGEQAPLLGVPIAIKDVICTASVPTTCGSRILEGYVPYEDATVITRLKEAGAVILGKTNCDEFAMGSSTENSAYFPTHNPWDLERVPGGSSGGSIAAVAAGSATLALGSETGGSVRQPASLCGIVGLKSTYGRISRYGLVAFASSLDQISPCSRDVEDCAVVTGVIAGPDPLDSTSSPEPVPDYLAELRRGVEGLRVGVPREYFGAGLDAGTERAVRAAIDVLGNLGAIVDEVSLPTTEYALDAYYVIAPAEASSNLARYDGVKYGFSARDAADMWDGYFKTRGRGFGDEVKRRIMLGTYALSAGYYDAYYVKAQKVRTLIKRDFDAAFERFDVLACPTSPTVAFHLGERTGDPLQMYLSDALTIPVNMAGICGISLPCGFADGLPVGLQLIAPAFGESTLFRSAHAYEQATDWHTRWPPL